MRNVGKSSALDKGLNTRGKPGELKINRNIPGWHKLTCLGSKSKNCYSKQLKASQEKYLTFREPQDECNNKCNLTNLHSRDSVNQNTTGKAVRKMTQKLCPAPVPSVSGG